MIRFFTAVPIIIICGLTVVCGWNMMEFSRARARIASHEAAVGSLHRWIGFPGLTTAAIDASLKEGTAATDINERARELAALLAVKPFSPADWVSLAGMWVAAGEPYERVLASFTMSRLTGPNEGDVMWERGIFGLLQWDLLPPDARSYTVLDIAGPLVARIVTDSGMKIAERVLSTKSVDTRTQISALLRKEGVSPAQLTRLGL